MKTLMGIYKITNLLNKKVYIGQSINVPQRISRHKYIGQNLNKYPDINSELYEDISKQGIDTFLFEVIEETPFEKLNQREKYWIAYYDSFNKGYNKTIGGKGTPKYDYNEIKLLWDQGYSNLDIANQFNTSYKTINNILTCLGISTEEKQARSKDRIQESHNKYKKKVFQQDLITHKIIQTFDSISAAANFIGVERATFREALQKHDNQYRGYYWRIEQPRETKDFKQKSVAQLDKETNEIIQVFPSVSAAAKAVDGFTSNISKACRENRISKGYKWKYYNI